jgi:cytochrome c
LVAAGEAGLVWDEAHFLEFVQDPKAFLRTYLDDTKAKSKMSFKLKKGGEDVLAYLISVSPAAEATD